VDYIAFGGDLKRVLDAATATSLDDAALTGEIYRLRALAGTIEPQADREEARLLIDALDCTLAVNAPPVSEAMSGALRVQYRARTAQGTQNERIDQLRARITEIGRIADGADSTQQGRTRPERIAVDADGTTRDHCVHRHREMSQPGLSSHRTVRTSGR